MAMTEAMSAGLPVVAYRSCIAASELIQSNCGILVSDGVPALADGLTTLMSNQSKRAAMGMLAKKSMDQYAPEKIWTKWELLLKRVVSESDGLAVGYNDLEKK